MESPLKALQGKSVLKHEDILRFKAYIENKYAQEEEAHRVRVLENTMSKIIDQHLIPLPSQTRSEICRYLKEKRPLGHWEGITYHDLLEASLQLPHQGRELLETLSRWISDQGEINVTPQELLRYREGLCPAPETEKKGLLDRLPPCPPYLLTILLGILLIPMGHLLLSLPTPVQEEVQPLPIVEAAPLPNLPEEWHYREVNWEGLKAYLASRNSLLMEEPYFSGIIETAKEFQINPLVLFAIAGHEQGFVPKDHPEALKIANNPFNVFSSWQNYNTDIYDSSTIAARTVINLVEDYPADMDPFQWVNRKYAEDENWWRGVRSIFDRLTREAA